MFCSFNINTYTETHYDSESQKSYVSTDQIYSSDMINARVLTAALNESKSDTFPKPSTSKEILTSCKSIDIYETVRKSSIYESNRFFF